MDLGRLGVWSSDIRRADEPAVAAAAELEQLGYGAIWYPAGSGTRGFDIARALLAGTDRITVATGITSIWATTAAESNAGFAALEHDHPGRFLLGVGVSHGPMVDRGHPGRYRRPLASTAEYLEQLTSVPRERRILAALSPKMLELAKNQTIGTHPYLVTPAMIEAIRTALGAGPIVAVEQGVVLDPEPARARAAARQYLSSYFELPNYVHNWLRFGYTDADVTAPGTDRLVDDLIAWGTVGQVGERIRAHFAAGADHVCVQVIGGGQPVPIEQWRAIAAELD
ncbi:MAG TPA: TIGR03620 family F420-dependent LLM class oxidoreductase [Jatrophihabitantaceae bacterium]|jgi:probable F420-dependent oxidoreductase